MRNLYLSGWNPPHTPKSWERTSLDRADARSVFTRWSINPEWGEPVNLVAWFDDKGTLRQLVGDFQNGRRAWLRVNQRGWRLTLSAAPQDLAREQGQ